jgi:hypothetical protein
MIINRTRAFSVIAGFLVILAGFYAVQRLPRISHSQQVGSRVPQNAFLRTKCLDEKGQVMSNDDGRLQYRCIDRKALLAQSGQPQAIRELADAVVEFNGTSDAPEVVLNEFEERLTRSELKYRTGNTDGVPEENIVRAVNNLAQKLNAPDYARTYRGEVRLLRGDSRSEMPHFISPEDQTMSPLEAAYVLHLLIYQKVFNETFLLTPDEHAALEREQHPGKVPTESTARTVTIHPRVKEMLALAHKTGAIKLTDLIEMARQLLGDLGIEG